MVTEEIIDRIKRLLAMRDGSGASSTEAEVAAAKVRRLLDEHGLTLAEVQALGKDKTAVEYHEVEHGFRRPPVWVKLLLLALAKGFDCQVVGKFEYLAVVGLEQDAAVALYLFRVLRIELEKAADAASAREREWRHGRDLRDYRESFLLAATERIKSRLQESRRGSGTEGLIACKKAIVDQAMPKEKSTTGTSIRSNHGANAGYAYGDRVHLGTDGIEQKAEAPLAITHAVGRRV